MPILDKGSIDMIDNKTDSVSYQVSVSEISNREIVEIIIRRISHRCIDDEQKNDIFAGC